MIYLLLQVSTSARTDELFTFSHGSTNPQSVFYFLPSWQSSFPRLDDCPHVLRIPTKACHDVSFNKGAIKVTDDDEVSRHVRVGKAPWN